MAEARAGALTDLEAVHGLEQQLLHALIECLSTDLTDSKTSAACRHRGILGRFEDLLVAESSLGMAEMCAALGISGRMLRECCKKHLGMGPNVTLASDGCNRCTAYCNLVDAAINHP